MMRWLALTILAGLAGPLNPAPLGERLSLDSEVLGESRDYRVFLPEHYGAHPEARFPVLYVLDGDYNFHYVTGLVSQLSTMSQRIPPMIVVGISGSGPDRYRANMTEMPRIAGLPRFARFLTEELKPAIDERYRAAPNTILSGHSIGGLFVLNTLMAEPEAFSAYVAISPALWGDDFAFLDHADAVLETVEALPANLYVSLANEKDMGVYAFVGALERHGAPGLRWEFRQYPGESHDSVGLPTLRDALQAHLGGFEMDRDRFNTLGTDPARLVGVYRDYAERHGFEPLLPRSFGQIVDFYAARERFEDLDALVELVEEHLPLSHPFVGSRAALAWYGAGRTDRAISLLENLQESHPQSVRVHEALAEIHADTPARARAHAARALELAHEQHLPRWRMNQLTAILEKTESSATNPQ